MVKCEINIDRACRSCLKENDGMLKIQDSVEIEITPNSHLTIAEILMECAAIKVDADDELPQSICLECVGKVQDAFIYKKMCEDSDVKLRTYLNNGLKMETDAAIQLIDSETNSQFVPEIVHFTDSYVRDDLFDENLDDDHLDGDIFDSNRMQSDCDDSEPNETTEVNESGSKDEHRQGEDFRLVNRAKRINGRYQCELCEKTLADRRTFLLHTRLHLGKNLKHCDVCGKGFAKKNHLDRHKKVHSAKSDKKKPTRADPSSSNVNEPKLKSLNAEKCPSVNAPQMEYKSEEQRESSENDTGESFVPGYQPMKMEEEMDGTYEICVDKSAILNKNQNNTCDGDEQQLVNSAKMMNGRLQCPICPRTLSQRKILRLHIRSHLGKNLLHCKICNRGFAKGSNLNRHMLLHCTVDNDEENQIILAATQSNGCYSCPFCAKTLIDRQTFRLHIRLHISKGLVRCEICNRGFEDDDELQKHMTSHGNQFTCNHCDQVFDTFRDRKHHLRTEHSPLFSVPNAAAGHVEQLNDIPKSQHHNDDDEDKFIVNESNCVNGRFECVFCKKTLANRTTLKYHIRLHLGKHLLKCDICGQGFSKKSHLKRHIATHARKKPCRYCDAVFETYEDRKIHSAAVHKDIAQNHTNKTIIPAWTQPNGQKQCICMICGLSFDHINELRNHLEWHRNEPTSFNGIDFSLKEDILTNFNGINRENQDIGRILREQLERNSENLSKLYCITNEHGWELSLSDSETEIETLDYEYPPKPKYNCGKCEQHFDRLHKLMCHMKVDHSSIEFQAFKCTHCLQYFPNGIILAKHSRQQCENQNKSFLCMLCNNRFTWKSSLDKHVAVYHEIDSKYINDQQNNVRPFNCDQCIKTFHRMDQLAAHKLSHIPRQKKFSCDICKKRFSRTDNLKCFCFRSHMRIHIPIEEREVVNKHLCSYCGRSFSNSSNLTVHIRRHTGERPFECEFCNARFPRSSDLQCHRRTHTGEKTCMCTVCGKGFTRSNKLVRHMRIHTGERPYKCSHCGRAFTQSNDLTLHVRRHTGDKPFGCYCGERFITNSLLQSHRRSAGHMDDSKIPLPSNSVNNPHRKFSANDGKRTGITATLSGFSGTENEEESNTINIHKQ